MTKCYELLPYENERPSEFAHRIGKTAAEKKPAHIKQKLGQFLTPLEIASFMSDLAETKIAKGFLRILDPGAGCAVLSCALIEKLVSNNSIFEIELVCYEIDKDILPFTKFSLSYLKDWLMKSGIILNFELRENDFIMANKIVFTDKKNFVNEEELFDFVISNPPFFKLDKNDSRAAAAPAITFGQPNIYSFFIYAASILLKADGELLFLIPRSFCSGNYFRLFRDKLLIDLKLKHIHLFSSESRLFESSSVLSDSIVVKACKNKESESSYKLDISCSNESNGKPAFTYSFIFDNKANIIPLPESEKDVRTLDIINSWKGSLIKYNLEIYPGMGNSLDSAKNYLLFRRYSTNLKGKRIFPIPFLKESPPVSLAETEKKLIIADRTTGCLDECEVLGLTAVFGSRFYDNYLRIINGSINISMEELGNLPLPSFETIREIGLNIKSLLKS